MGVGKKKKKKKERKKTANVRASAVKEDEKVAKTGS